MTTATITLIADALTEAQARDYIAQGPRWLSVGEVLSNPHLRKQAAEKVFAGANPMEHHAPNISFGGMDGGMQTMLSAASPEAAKHRAGAWLVNARWNRARGNIKAAREALKRAAMDRQRATQTKTIIEQVKSGDLLAAE